MQRYSQKNKGYEKIKLGTCTKTMRSHGCFAVTLGNMASIDPIEVNRLLTTQGGYSQGCLMNSEKAAQILGLIYEGKTKTKPRFICVAETDHYKQSGYKQHFFVFAPQGTVSDLGDYILDPLDDPYSIAWKPNKYNIVSYRLFREKEIDPLEKLTPEERIAWYDMKDAGIFTEETKVDTLITTQKLAVFLSRLTKK